MKRIEKLAVKLYTGAIELEEFTSELYSETMVLQMDSNAFVYDLMEIDFSKNSQWSYQLSAVLEKHFSEDRLTVEVLRVYSLQLVESNDFGTSFLLLGKVNKLFDYEFYSGVVYEFYYLFDVADDWSWAYTSEKEMRKDVFFKSKEYAHEFLQWISDKEKIIDYQSLLKKSFSSSESVNLWEEIDYEPLTESEVKRIEINSMKIEKKENINAILIYLLLGIIKTYVGFVALGVGKFMYAFLVVGIGMLITSIYYTIQLQKVNKKIKQT